MMRVLLATMASERGGAEAVMETIASRLDLSQFVPVMATPEGGALADRWRDAGFEAVGLSRVDRLRRVDHIRAAIARTTDALRERRIDLVYTHGIAAHIVAGRAARRAGIPVVCHSHDRFNAAWTADGLLHRAAVWTPRAHTIVVSRTVADSLRGRVPANALSIVPNGVAAGLVAPILRDDEAPRVVWCGRLQRWKGAHVFLRAAQLVRARRPDARFFVVGDALFGMEPEYPTQVRALATELGLDDCVTFTGHVSDARPWLSSASVVVHSSTREDPFPLVVLEAMMQGRVVVAFARGGPGEALDDTCGVLVAPDDEAALAQGIARVLDAPEEAARMGAAARVKALDVFDVDRMVRRVETILRSAAPAEGRSVNH